MSGESQSGSEQRRVVPAPRYAQGELLAPHEVTGDPEEAFPGEADLAEQEIMERRVAAAMSSGTSLGEVTTQIVETEELGRRPEDPGAIIESDARAAETSVVLSSPSSNQALVLERLAADKEEEARRYEERLRAGSSADAVAASAQLPVNVAGRAKVDEALAQARARVLRAGGDPNRARDGVEMPRPVRPLPESYPPPGDPRGPQAEPLGWPDPPRPFDKPDEGESG